MVDEGDQSRKLQVANRGCVERHRHVRRVRANGQGLGSDPSLIGLEVLEHNARGADRQRRFRRADGSRISDAEKVFQALTASLRIESILLDVRRSQELRRRQPVQLGREPLAGHLAQQQLACRHVARGQAGLAAARPGRHKVVGPHRLEVRVFDHGARSQHTGDVTLHDRLARRGFDLVADHHLVPGPQQLADIALPRVMRHAAHRRPSRLAERTRGERHAHDRRRRDRILEEDLVEVTEPKQQDPVWVLPLRLPVLLHDRGQRSTSLPTMGGGLGRGTFLPTLGGGLGRGTFLPTLGGGLGGGSHAARAPVSWPAVA